MSNEPKKLYRSRQNKVIAGVCGGIGEYFNLDPVIVRVGFVIFLLCGGSGVLAYLIAWVIMPLPPETTTPPSATPPAAS